ncbi:hypothetical protein M8Z33_28460 [Streptomyces sp. ZAF1911]|uniref:hypothetical protein n=1 Tax=Streptomyces sp. ZAF1911 TaxID=2944129 RepID=UPI00237BD865|nr:hypothetical protein [Streptomyces sp. ZAF1911]MDD9380516.1 hypothetical protein [Streptomyces sp. ZAF1911]
MTVTGRHAGSATRLLCALQTAVAVPAGVLLAGRLPGGHAVGAALAAMAAARPWSARACTPARAEPPRATGRRPARPRTRAVLSLALGAVAGAGLAAGPALTAPALVGLGFLLGCAAAIAPPTAPAGTVLVWSAGPPLAVFAALLAGTGAVFGVLAALNTVALALLLAGPSAPLTACAAHLARLRRLLTTPATHEPWPTEHRRWVNQRTP